MWRHRCNSSIFGGDRIIAETAFCDGASSASVSWQTVVCVMGSHFFLRLRRSRYLCQRSQRFPLSPSGCNGRGSFPKDSFFLQCHERTMFCFPFHCSYSFLLCFPTFPNRFTWCAGARKGSFLRQRKLFWGSPPHPSPSLLIAGDVYAAGMYNVPTKCLCRLGERMCNSAKEEKTAFYSRRFRNPPSGD